MSEHAINTFSNVGSWELLLEVRAADEERLAALLFDYGAAGVEIFDPAIILRHLEAGDWDASVYDAAPPQAGRVKLRALLPDDADGVGMVAAIVSRVRKEEDVNISVMQLPATDWLSRWRESFPAFSVGKKLFITPHWRQDKPEAGRLPLIIDPGSSFGTGDHATTAMMLELIEEYIEPGGRVIDFGCGSGILSVAALLLGASEAVAVDIDAECGPALARHLEINGLPEASCRFYVGDILAEERLQRQLRQDKAQLVLANINSAAVNPLCGVVGRFLAPGGFFLCSGMLAEYGGITAQALVNAGLSVLAGRERDGWAAFAAVAAYE